MQKQNIPYPKILSKMSVVEIYFKLYLWINLLTFAIFSMWMFCYACHPVQHDVGRLFLYICECKCLAVFRGSARGFYGENPAGNPDNNTKTLDDVQRRTQRRAFVSAVIKCADDLLAMAVVRQGGLGNRPVVRSFCGCGWRLRWDDIK